jgi:hypothetical protein
MTGVPDQTGRLADHRARQTQRGGAAHLATPGSPQAASTDAPARHEVPAGGRLSRNGRWVSLTVVSLVLAGFPAFAQTLPAATADLPAAGGTVTAGVAQPPTTPATNPPGAGDPAVRAQVISVLSGEHGGFSRLAVVLPRGAVWRFGRSGGGYELRIEGRPVAFDTRRVYDLIPRRRITGVKPGQAEGSLAVSVAHGTFATAFESAGAVVVDVADGRAPENSPAEAPIDPLHQNAGQAGAMGGRMLPLYRADRPPASDPWIDAIWTAGQAARQAAAKSARDSGPPTQGDAENASAEQAALRATEEALVRQLARAASQGLVSTQAEEDIASLAQKTPDSADAAASGGTAVPPATGAGQAGEDSPAPASDPPPEAATGSATGGGSAPEKTATVPGTDAAQATQPDHTATSAPQDWPPDSGAEDPAAMHADGKVAATADVPVGEAPASTKTVEEALASIAAAHVGIRARTSEDRDSIKTPAAPPETTDGKTCPPDAELDVASWSGDGAPDLQIAAARTVMVGEFDRPDTEKVVSLARLYLSFGLGAEARDVLDAFEIPDADAPLLRPLSDVMEDRIPADAALAGLAACPGPSALWGALAIPPGDPRPWNADTVLRSLSGLPPRLRTLLAPPVAERLLARGEPDRAQAAMDTIARLPEAPGPAAALVRARIGLARQDVTPALDEISGLIASNAPATPDAVVLAIQGRLSRGEAVDPALTDTAAALAFEHRADPLGVDLATAHVAALAAAGRYADAFTALRTHRSDSPGADFAPAVRQIFQLLADHASDEDLVAAYDAARGELLAAKPDKGLRRALAGRLANLGFSAETSALLSAGGPGGDSGLVSEADRMTYARAALADMRPDQAIDALAGIGGPAAADMRDRALAMTGTTPAPAVDGAAAAAPAEGAAPPLAEGPLARGKALVAQSKALRDQLDGLLAADAAPAGSSAGTGPGTASAQGGAAGGAGG